MDQGRARAGNSSLNPFFRNSACSTGRLAAYRERAGRTLTALLLMFASACAGSGLFLSSGPSPRVEDCMLVQQSTPTKFACGGKTLTSVQLADIRNGGDVKAR